MDNRDYLEGAIAVAKEAGAILRRDAASLREIEFLDRRDVKLRADIESEELIRGRLQDLFRFPIYGEERGGDASLPAKDEPFWVVDPLDGTYNYMRGSGLCAVSIGLMRGLNPIAGVIYNFNSDTCYSGCAGGRFWINNRAVTPAYADTIDQAALATGFPAGMNRSHERMQAFLKRIAPFKKVRMVGSAALAIAEVAAGVYDVYYEEGIRLWDVAAGLALVTAAGGSVSMTPSDSGKTLAYDVWAGKSGFFAI